MGRSMWMNDRKTRRLVDGGAADIPQPVKGAENDPLRPQGTQQMTGVVVAGEKEHTFSAVNDVKNRQFFWIELPTIAGMVGLPTDLEYLVDATNFVDGEGHRANKRNDTWPVQKTAESYMTFYTTTQTHLIYAFTWYTLAVAGAVIAKVRFL